MINPFSDVDQAERLTAMVRRFVRSRMRDAEAADDVAQEVLLKISKSAESLIHGERLDAWAFRIARNQLADYFRTARISEEFRDESHGQAGDSMNPVEVREEGAMRGELAAYVRSVVESLSPIYREALVLTEYEGLPQTELALKLGLSLSAAKSRVQRARVLLKRGWSGVVTGQLIGMARLLRWFQRLPPRQNGVSDALIRKLKISCVFFAGTPSSLV